MRRSRTMSLQKGNLLPMLESFHLAFSLVMTCLTLVAIIGIARWAARMETVSANHSAVAYILEKQAGLNRRQSAISHIGPENSADHSALDVRELSNGRVVPTMFENARVAARSRT